ncbi:MAG: hypothetical protein GVY35_12890 [Bacteroidetes bacterium]|nr:hypothetical protein [Bacteroidota bacterium]
MMTLLAGSALLISSLLFGGCFLSEDGPPPSAACAGTAQGFANAAASPAGCNADPRGEWVDGRCYCHSAADDARR